MIFILWASSISKENSCSILCLSNKLCGTGQELVEEATKFSSEAAYKCFRISLAAVLPTTGCEGRAKGFFCCPSECCSCVVLVCFQKSLCYLLFNVCSLVVINCAESDNSYSFSHWRVRKCVKWKSKNFIVIQCQKLQIWVLVFIRKLFKNYFD